MKKRVVFILSIAMIFLCACGNQNASSTYKKIDFFAMDTYMSLTAKGKNAEKTLKESKEYVIDLENKISRTKENSDVYQLNNSNGKIVTVNPDTYAILKIALEEASKTKGVFEPTICPITDLWGIGTDKARVPAEDEIHKALEMVSYKNIVLMDHNQVQLKNNAKIDLGGIGKGYCADKLREIYRKNGTSSGMISLSGNIYAVGEKEKNTPWNIGVADPDNKEVCKLSIEINDYSVVTSGGYERYFEKDGKIYAHIFDPATGHPVSGDIKSITIVSKKSALADIYSTALYTMSFQDAVAFLESRNDIYGIIIGQSNQIYISEFLKTSVNH